MTDGQIISYLVVHQEREKGIIQGDPITEGEKDHTGWSIRRGRKGFYRVVHQEREKGIIQGDPISEGERDHTG